MPRHYTVGGSSSSGGGGGGVLYSVSTPLTSVQSASTIIRPAGDKPARGGQPVQVSFVPVETADLDEPVAELDGNHNEIGGGGARHVSTIKIGDASQEGGAKKYNVVMPVAPTIRRQPSKETVHVDGWATDNEDDYAKSSSAASHRNTYTVGGLRGGGRNEHQQRRGAYSLMPAGVPAPQHPTGRPILSLSISPGAH